jgi:tRNA-binding protein
MQETSSLPHTEPQIPVDDFFRVDVRAGRVVAAEPFPEARKPSYKLWIDFGDLGTKQSSAQITARYAPGQLVDRLVVAVTNLPPRRVAGFVSEVLVLGVPVPGTDEVVLLAPDADVPVGARVS